ncbi:MAG: DUF4349 domain-containing protein [Bacteroidia bacterium]
MKKLIPFVCALVLIGACNSSRSHKKYSTSSSAYRSSSTDNAQSADFEMGGGKLAETEDRLVTARMINYSASFSLEVKKHADTTLAQVGRLAKELGGWVESSSVNYCRIRVRSENFQKATARIETLGKVTSKNIQADDVTEQHADLKMRLENAEKARARYLELLAKAQTVDEMLKVEKELERINLVIEQLKSNLEQVEENNRYSTIGVYVREKTKPGIVGYVFVGLYKGVKWLFVRN